LLENVYEINLHQVNSRLFEGSKMTSQHTQPVLDTPNNQVNKHGKVQMDDMITATWNCNMHDKVIIFRVKTK